MSSPSRCRDSKLDVTTTGLDPTAGLVALPTDLVDASGLIAQGCPADQGNAFVISGRGGFPPTPEQQLDDDADWQDRGRLVVAPLTQPERRSRSQAAATNSPQRESPPATPFVEATAWQVSPTGAINLVASTPDPMEQKRLAPPLACQERSSATAGHTP